jgi:hypothetical protein
MKMTFRLGARPDLRITPLEVVTGGVVSLNLSSDITLDEISPYSRST